MLFDVANTIDCITGNPLEWYSRGYRACDHSRRKLWFGRKAGIGGTYAASRRSGSSVHSFGRYSVRSMNAWPWREALSKRNALEGLLIGRSEQIKRVRSLVSEVANSPVDVLIHGET